MPRSRDNPAQGPRSCNGLNIVSLSSKEPWFEYQSDLIVREPSMLCGICQTESMRFKNTLWELLTFELDVHLGPGHPQRSISGA